MLASPDFDPRALMNDTFVNFTKAMEVIDTVPGYVEAPLVPAG